MVGDEEGHAAGRGLMWAEVWRYADDFGMGFQHRADAERFLSELRERLAKFGLELHPDKTPLIEFGRDAARGRKQRGEGKPETFTFLGFTHHCGERHKRGTFTVRRITALMTASVGTRD